MTNVTLSYKLVVMKKYAALILAVVALTACDPDTTATPDPGPPATTNPDPATDTPTDPSDTPNALGSLTIAPEPTRTGYDRDLFKHWSDLDGDGCDTRQEVLITESLTDGSVDSRCNIVDGGTWTSLYDNETGITDPSSLDIDHMVPLAEAWDSGAANWNADRREAFANDLTRPESLIAVSASSNRRKSDKDPAEYQPSNRDAWCQYANDWISVKAAWDLTIDQAEHDALANMLNGCEQSGTPTDTPTPPAPTTPETETTEPPPETTTTVAPAPTTVPAPTTTTPAATSDCDPNYTPADGSCIPPRSIVGDLDCGDLRPEQKPVTVGTEDPHRMDIDRDGTGCEHT